VLLTDDATGRGLDVPNVPFVLHHEVPRAKAAYVHRAGRTGRAGQSGLSVLFADTAGRGEVRRLEKQLKLSFTPLPSR
jgi:ATP-dependent RNA helicase DeaD